jgi:hypothetical protein
MGLDLPSIIQKKDSNAPREHSGPCQYCYTSIMVRRESRVVGNVQKCEAYETLYRNHEFF